MRDRRAALAALVLFTLAGTPVLVAQDFDTEGYEHVISSLRCDCGCAPQSLQECVCGYAANKRDEIRHEMVGNPAAGQPGKTADVMIATAIATKGEDILLIPRAANFNLLVWLAPIAALVLAVVGGLTFLFLHTRRPAMATAGVSMDAPASSPDAADAPYLRRIEDRLKELD